MGPSSSSLPTVARTGMTKRVDRVFLDTNVLLRATFSGMEVHELCRECIERLQVQSDLWISNQVIREFYRQGMRAKVVGRQLAGKQILFELETLLLRFSIAEETNSVHAQLMTILRDASPEIPGLLIHDANIVATMLANHIDTLVTRDSDFQRFRDYVDISSPSEAVS